jgi:c-di-AMP phosphodiesterase-like protein
MKYIRKPLIIIPTIISLLIGGITMFTKYELFSVILIVLSIILMGVSFIEALVSKKWLKGFLYFIFYTIFLLITAIWLFSLAISDPSNDLRNGTSEFYNERLNNHLESNEDFQLTTLCKQDEFHESFTGDLNATCIFKLNKKEYENLISEIENNENFEWLSIKDFDHQIDVNKLECSKNITFKKNGYQSVNTGMYARIIISSDNKYCLFNLDYY